MFTPGQIITEFTTKSGRHAVIRYPKWEDVAALMEHINTVSLENTYITFGGEQETLASESQYLGSEFALMEQSKAVKLFCFVEGKLAGVCDIHQNTAKKKRGLHVGIFGLVIGKLWRGEGVGFALAQATLAEAKAKISALKMVYLECYAANLPALSLYAKLGFKEAGRIPGALFYKDEYIDEVLMYKNI